MLKEFFIKKMIASRLKSLPPEQRRILEDAVLKHPDLFEKMGKEIKKKVKEGKSETQAAMEVMRAHQSELARIMRR